MKTFLKSESGVISVEYAMWLPVLVALVILGINASFLLIKQAQIYDINRQVARQLVIGAIQEGDLTSTIQTFWPGSSAYTAQVTPDPNFLILTISVPFREVIVFGDLFPLDQLLQSRIVMAKDLG